MKKTSRIVALLMTAVMMLSLTACAEEQMDFMKNGWDGGKDPITVVPANDESVVISEETPLAEAPSENETAADSKEETAESNNTDSKTTQKAAQTTKKAPSKNSTTKKPSSNTSTTKATTTKATATQKTYTAAEALDLYKAAANPIKTKSGVTVTRTREVYTEVGESNLSGLSGTIISAAFAPKDDTDKKVFSTKEDIIKSFVVEQQSYVCNLTTSDIKSASVKLSGNNKIVTIYVKDDTSGQNYSNKAVSATAVANLATKFASGLSMSCKDVRVTATIDANGRLINLNTYMPCYFTKGEEHFGAAIEQWWSISYS